MATFNKRGYKVPKPKAEKTENEFDNNEIEEVVIDEKDSTTAEVFNSLDQTASKTEEWVERNQKIIFGILGAVALVTVGYILYGKFVSEPNQDKAANDMFQAQQYFKQATDASEPKKIDSLYKLALNGGEGQYGFIKLADEYSGTDAGNLSHYYAGLALLNTGKYADAIAQLEQFKSEDSMLKTLAIGAIGDAYMEQNKAKEALEFYINASENNVNELTTPRFLLKAGQTALSLNQKEEALKYFNQIKDKYEASQEASTVDAYIGLAQ
ncbi:hypothetical protein B0A58_00125 [Flavobacterium branchiophilum NBRC 15030 = ATCC 35035]|uniref:Tetratricopeptide repeat protein n=1 Tax=Flavobacterium branchiophilum TaxID=55197 RepID=A0A543G0F2_9FLAO|nr:tetratricopeptide repeat protein [Flavobacterium branchiophilum]OXA82417.1 hypothetical protein B0A58_00125 [Flavobacterium branchiophilum NBRC 15030 = ATCC 35035]TQM39566.1 tetratricopeptide repeat protein [Flavobacterium branchiophilum]GEM56062.1 hypothetical protein FB1_22830 [Flavobacterium branchiophilum NBRC 15030 = ATCC 35035]